MIIFKYVNYFNQKQTEVKLAHQSSPLSIESIMGTPLGADLVIVFSK